LVTGAKEQLFMLILSAALLAFQMASAMAIVVLRQKFPIDG
jgi:hypothetical protein